MANCHISTLLLELVEADAVAVLVMAVASLHCGGTQRLHLLRDRADIHAFPVAVGGRARGADGEYSSENGMPVCAKNPSSPIVSLDGNQRLLTRLNPLPGMLSASR